MPVQWLVMGSIVQRSLVTIIQQGGSKANHQTFATDDRLHHDYEWDYSDYDDDDDGYVDYDEKLDSVLIDGDEDTRYSIVQ